MLLQSLAQALDAGMSVQELVLDPSTSALLPPRARDVLRRSLREGGAFADALLAAELVDEGGAAVVAAGERGGFLPAALRQVAADVERARQRRRRALLALAYPALLMVLSSLILPLPVIVSEGVAAYFARAAPGILLVVVLLVLALVALPRLPTRVRAAGVAALARWPLFGAIFLDEARGAALEVLGRLIAAGVPMRHALAAALTASGLSTWRGRIVDAEQALDSGRTLAEALAAVPIGDASLIARIALAERTGKLDVTMPVVANEARERAARRTVALTIACGLLAFLVMAVGIGRALVVQTQSTFEAIERATAE